MSDTHDYSEGLGLERLNPPHILAFITGLPRRLGETISADADSAEQRITSTRDQLDDLINTLKGAGFSQEPGIESTPAAHRDLDPVATAATEAARWIAGIPADGWADDQNLLEAVRDHVARLSRNLRHSADDRSGGDDRAT